MLQLSDAQMTAFRKLAKEQFIGRLAVFVKEHFSAARDTPIEMLRDELTQQVENAAELGLMSKRQTLAYVAAVYIAGKDFLANDVRLFQRIESATSAEEKETILTLWLEDRGLCLDPAKES